MELLELLDKRGIEYRKTNNPNEIAICCTSGEHEDNSPSLQYNLEKDIFNCWSCGFSGGQMKFLQSIGEITTIDVTSKQPYKIKKLKDKLRKLTEINEIKLPEDWRIYNEEFRGISKETLKQFKAFTTYNPKFQDYLCIPIYQHGKLKFIEGRLLKDLENQPKYFRQPASSKVSDIVFPLDKIGNTNYVILVEGLFDVINMWDLGYTNTLCIFGTSNFNKYKAELLDNIGVTAVDIMMDSDKAGAKAANNIANLLDSRNIFSRIIKLPPGIDPGELTTAQADLLLNNSRGV